MAAPPIVSKDTIVSVPQPPPARFSDVIVLVFLFMVSLAFFSVIYYRGLTEEVRGAERAVRSLRERDATLQEKLDNTMATAELNEADARVPHPVLHDRDANFIGDHADVSWNYNNKGDSKYISYELELWRNSGGKKCDPADTNAVHLQNQRFWEGCSNGPKKFIASDPGSLSSRIPADLDQKLVSGSYSWRVAPIRAGANVNTRDDDADILSDWSELSSFTIHRSLLDRIMETHEVRIGTNFEQDTRFSRRDENGYEVGFDISLIRTLVEGCLQLTASGIGYDSSRCATAVKAAQDAGYKNEIGSSDCQHSGDTTNLCIRFVPVGSWGGWQGILKRKEIDLFIGSVTRAAARERAGIVFTDGYLNYETKLYVHKTDFQDGSALLNKWLSKERVIGVIESSTNEYLLDRLRDDEYKAKLKKLGFSSYPALESAMERGDVDGIIIDDTFVSDTHPDWISIEDLTTKQGWLSYMSGYIGPQPNGGPPIEQIAIATIREKDSNRGLFSALQTALRKKEISERLLPGLCHSFWNGSAGRCSVGAQQ